MTRDVLPLGSVVRLVDAAEPLVMVCGYEPRLGEEAADYLGVFYPAGLVSQDAALGFDAAAIDEVVHYGFWDDEAQEALEAVRAYRTLAREAIRAVDELIEGLTPEKVAELEERYAATEDDGDPAPPATQWQEGTSLLASVLGAGGQKLPSSEIDGEAPSSREI